MKTLQNYELFSFLQNFCPFFVQGEAENVIQWLCRRYFRSTIKIKNAFYLHFARLSVLWLCRRYFRSTIKIKNSFLFAFRSLILTLTSSKVLSLDNKNKK